MPNQKMRQMVMVLICLLTGKAAHFTSYCAEASPLRSLV